MYPDFRRMNQFELSSATALQFFPLNYFPDFVFLIYCPIIGATPKCQHKKTTNFISKLRGTKMSSISSSLEEENEEIPTLGVNTSRTQTMYS